jgi:hypothetical protein
MRTATFILLIVLVSCSPFKFRTLQFTDNENHSISVVVPKGYSKVDEGLDTAGNWVRTYHYSGNTKFFIEKTNREIEWLDTTFHVAKIHPNGAVMYKYMEDGPVYTREVRLKNYRFGYVKVSPSLEIRFDSAVNHIRDRSF